MLHKCSSYNTHREIRIHNIVECYLQYRAHVHSSCGKHLNYFQFYAGFVYAHNIELCPVWIGPDWPLCRPYRSSIVYTGVISSLQKKKFLIVKSWLPTAYRRHFLLVSLCYILHLLGLFGILVIQSFDRFLQIKTNQLGKGSYFILRSEKSEVRE